MISKSLRIYEIYYSLKCRKNKERKHLEVVKTKNGKVMLLSKCSVCNSKNSTFLKEQAGGLISNLTGIKIPILSDLAILKDIF